MSEVSQETTTFFDQFTFQNLLIPIIVAILTTLIIEYFAKPWLEARKERLIRNRQQVDEVIFQFQKASASFGALIPDNVKSPQRNKHNDVMLSNAISGLYGITEALSRLPHRYVEKHSIHIGKTVKFVGYLIALSDRDDPQKSNNPTVRKIFVKNTKIDSLKSTASDLDKFDIYFLSNLSSQDSQEKWYRRFFWNKFTRKDNAKEVDKVLEKNNLSDRANYVNYSQPRE